LLSRRVAPGTRERGWGRIIFVSSVATFTGGVVRSHYTASKAAFIGLMHALAGPLVPHGVLVNTIAPALPKGGATVTGSEDSQRQFAKYTRRAAG
jgi:3-oxoacyl-[acyl-carrier protein] reductase